MNTIGRKQGLKALAAAETMTDDELLTALEAPREVIAVWTISNVATLSVYELNDEAVLAGINDDEPEWYEVTYQIDEDDAENVLAGITFGGSFWRLDECMRVRF